MADHEAKVRENMESIDREIGGKETDLTGKLLEDIRDVVNSILRWGVEKVRTSLKWRCMGKVS